MRPRAALGALLLAVAAPHPVHTSTATLRLAADGARVELRVFTDDLEDAARAARTSPAAYALGRFSLRDRDGRALVPRLDSVTADGPATVVHATVRGVPAAVRHAVLQERFADQVNVVRALGRRGGVTRVFSPGDGYRPL